MDIQAAQQKNATARNTLKYPDDNQQKNIVDAQ